MNPRPSSYEALPWVLTPEEVAPLLNVSMCTVYALLRSNQLKHTHRSEEHTSELQSP